MFDFTSVVMHGTLIEAPQLSFSQDQEPYCSFIIRVMKKSGSYEHFTHVNCFCKGQKAVLISEKMIGGDSVTIRGELKSSEFKNQKGKTVYVLSVFAKWIGYDEDAVNGNYDEDEK